jgi:hypothetical protein
VVTKVAKPPRQLRNYPDGIVSSSLELKGEGSFPRQPCPSTGQCETQDTIPSLSGLLGELTLVR